MNNNKPTEDYNNIEKGLIEREFVGTENIDSMRRCNKNNKHFILRTDGLIIYTTYPWTHSEPPSKKDFKQYWGMEEFTFKKLDEVMKIVDL
jgi:hypothetical protein